MVALVSAKIVEKGTPEELGNKNGLGVKNYQ